MPVDYHAWTHRPKSLGGTDPLEIGVSVFRAYRHDDASIGLTMVDLNWDEDWENGNTDVFTPLTSGGADAVQGVDEVRYVDLNLPGRYTFCAGFNFGTTFDGSVGIMLQDDNNVLGTPYMTVHGPTTYGGSSLGNQGFLIATYSRVYPLLDPFASGGQFPTRTYWQIAQNSSAAKTLTEAFLDIHYEPVTLPPLLS